MFKDTQTWMILLGIGILVLIFVYCSRTREMERFSNDLETFYEDNSNKGIDNFKIDELPCSPSCCGGYTDVPYDGLTSGELMRNLSLQGRETPFIRTNMTCGNGPNTGVGCPCMRKPQYEFLVNHGENSMTKKESCDRNLVEPTLYLRTPSIYAALGGYAGSGPAEVNPIDS